MKKYFAFILLALSIKSFAANKPQWERMENHYYGYIAQSTDGYGVSAQMKMTNNTNAKNLIFRLFWEHEEFCSKVKDRKSKLTLYVAHREVKFTQTCANNQFVVLYPTDKEKGNSYIFETFLKARGKDVSFVRLVKDAEDIKYTIPSNGFKPFYKEAQKAMKPVL